MLGQMEGDSVPEELKNDAFNLLVLGQDYAMNPDESREMVCVTYNLMDWEVRGIEQEGIARKWPPIS